jgi:hypothetical protein
MVRPAPSRGPDARSIGAHRIDDPDDHRAHRGVARCRDLAGAAALVEDEDARAAINSLGLLVRQEGYLAETGPTPRSAG